MTFEAKILANTLYVKGIVSRYRVTPVYGLMLGGSVVKCIVKCKKKSSNEHVHHNLPKDLFRLQDKCISSHLRS